MRKKIVMTKRFVTKKFFTGPKNSLGHKYQYKDSKPLLSWEDYCTGITLVNQTSVEELAPSFSGWLKFTFSSSSGFIDLLPQSRVFSSAVGNVRKWPKWLLSLQSKNEVLKPSRYRSNPSNPALFQGNIVYFLSAVVEECLHL